MLSKKTLELEAVLPLIGTIVMVFLLGNIAAGLLLHTHANGFKTELSIGTILLATLSFHGTVIVLGTGFLVARGSSWRDVFGNASWMRSLGLACGVLALITPVVLGLEYASEIALNKMRWPVESQEAVKMILNAPAGLRVYLAVFAIVLAPVAEEFFFRGLLFPLVKQIRLPGFVRFVRQRGHPRFAWFLRQQIWRVLAWVGVSLLFAAMHVNPPIFLSLFGLALALTWLYEKTNGLLAPIMAHSLFNTANLIFLLLAEKYGTS